MGFEFLGLEALLWIIIFLLTAIGLGIRDIAHNTSKAKSFKD